MADDTLTLTENTTAYEIASKILKKYQLRNVVEQCRCKIEEWIVRNNNNDYRFASGSTIKIPNEDEILHLNDTFCAYHEGTSGTSCQCGWRLTTNGKLVRGETGWLTDENGLYILKDGRRLFEEQLKTTEERNLRIGCDDIWDGLGKILGNLNDIKKTESMFITSELFKKYGPFMTELVVYQAFQINICYTNENWNPCTRKQTQSSGAVIPATNCVYKKIGTDETDIPIVVTRVGYEDARNKLVIAGPHGNERIARFVVLETQKYFIEKGIFAPELVLYFVPAMSPTMFFADARGLPFITIEDGKYKYSGDMFANERKNNYSIVQCQKNIEDKIDDICKYLTIPKLHDFIAEKVNGSIMHDNIQLNNELPVIPKYGIDTNRDYHDVLKSTKVFGKFIRGLNASPRNITVLMLHGHEDVNNTRVNNHNGEDQGTIAGPYMIKLHPENNKKEIGYINDNEELNKENIKKYIDFMTSVLFGYQYNEINVPINSDNDRQKNYFFDSNTNVTKFIGEWSRKLYGSAGSGIPCFDIELSNNYRDGTRGKKSEKKTDGPNMMYYSNFVINRNNLPFFKKIKDVLNGKFTEIALPNDGYLKLSDRPKPISFTISFYEFLEIYFKYRDQWDFQKRQ